MSAYKNNVGICRKMNNTAGGDSEKLLNREEKKINKDILSYNLFWRDFL
jgi:hypothetical protein